jgi:SEC-C motif-containing protein
MSKCPCCSGIEFEDCCGPYLNGEKNAPTAEALMRSRYSAFAKENMEYLRSTLHPKSRSDYDEASARAWSRESDWKALEIVSTQKGGKEDNEGSVEFIAQYLRNGKEEFHHEVAEFARADGRWYFVDGKLVGKTPFVRTEPKVGRNDPCSCGSGKKYKKCCGK